LFQVWYLFFFFFSPVSPKKKRLPSFNELKILIIGFLVGRVAANGLQIGDVAGLEALNCKTTTKVF